MTNPIVSEERAGSIYGVNGRFFARTIGGNNYKPGTFTKQRWISESRTCGKNEFMRAEIRFDDDCRNGHNTFAITCDIFERTINGRVRDIGGGAAHDEIARVFPELAPLIKWHLCSTDGPMHYVANTVYHASDRDHRGKRAGEPRAWDSAVQFGDNPIKHKLKDGFAKFLQESAAHPGKERFDFEVIELSEKRKSTSGQDEYYRKYTFGGFASKWYECPFDTEQQALDFLKALQTCNPQFLKTPTLFSEGKARDFKAARSCAIWPDASDEILSLEKPELTAALEARLPGLVDEFRAAIESAGFVWQPE